MNRAKRTALGRIKPPRRYARLLSTQHPSTVDRDREQLRLRIKLRIPADQRVPSRQQRRAEARR